MKEYCIFAQVVQRQWPWNSLMNRYLSDDFISPSQTRRLKNHSKHFFHILPVSRDISPALILMLMSINLLIWRQLRLMPFVRMRACAFHWARRWFALLSVRVIKPQHGVEHLIDFFNLFCVENGSNGIHSDISKAHMWAVNTHTHKPAALWPFRGLSHCQAISSSWADGLFKSQTKTRKSAQNVWRRGKTRQLYHQPPPKRGYLITVADAVFHFANS